MLSKRQDVTFISTKKKPWIIWVLMHFGHEFGTCRWQLERKRSLADVKEKRALLCYVSNKVDM